MIQFCSLDVSSKWLCLNSNKHDKHKQCFHRNSVSYNISMWLQFLGQLAIRNHISAMAHIEIAAWELSWKTEPTLWNFTLIDLVKWHCRISLIGWMCFVDWTVYNFHLQYSRWIICYDNLTQSNHNTTHAHEKQVVAL